MSWNSWCYRLCYDYCGYWTEGTLGVTEKFTMVYSRKTSQVRGLKPFLCDSKSQPMISESFKKSTENVGFFTKTQANWPNWEELQQVSWENPINDTGFLQKSTVTFKKSGSDRTKNYPPTWLVFSSAWVGCHCVCLHGSHLHWGQNGYLVQVRDSWEESLPAEHRLFFFRIWVFF